MRLLFISFLCSLSFFSIDISEVRKNYSAAWDNPEITEELYQALSNSLVTNDNLLQAYKGAVLTLKAKHSKTIKDKKTFFKEGVVLLESSIASNPKNIEIRFIRLSIQEYAPKIVRYNSNMEEDKLFIQQNYSTSKNEEVKKLIKNYIASSTYFTEAEKQLF